MAKLQVLKILNKLYSLMIPYETSEHRIGTWINGKPLYRKVVELGNLPNNTSVNISLGLTINDKIVKGEGYFYAGSILGVLPFVSTQSQYSIDFYFENGNAIITTYRDRSNWQGIAVVYYTKTTD